MRSVIALALAGLASAASAQTFCIDFTTEDDFVTALGNGQIIDTEFGNLLTISGTGGAGLAIFDSNPAGPNAGGPDPDLLVGLGNLLIIQSSSASASSGGFFNTPNDSAGNGTITFDFLAPALVTSIDLVDIDSSVMVTVTLTDGEGDMRIFDVPNGWTFDKQANPGADGYATLNLTTLASQAGETAVLATASQDAGFDIGGVVQMTVASTGSFAVDNVKFVPTPASAVLLGAGGLLGFRRRRA